MHTLHSLCQWTDSSFLEGKSDELVQERHNSIALALELHLSCTNPSKWSWHWLMIISWTGDNFGFDYFHIIFHTSCYRFAWIQVLYKLPCLSRLGKFECVISLCDIIVWYELIYSQDVLGTLFFLLYVQYLVIMFLYMIVLTYDTYI